MAKGSWVTIKDPDKHFAQFKKRLEPHAFTKMILHWPYCKHCGLMLLKNDASRRAARKKCEIYE